MVLTTANRYGCKVLIASTSEVYGKRVKFLSPRWMIGSMGPTMNSRWAYATSKAIDEFLGLAYNRQFGLPVVVMRLFNMVGPRQTGRYGMVLSRFVRQALRNEPIQVYGDGQQLCCFADVLDVVDAVVKLAEHPEAVGNVFNIGATEEITINDLAQQILELTGSPSEIVLVPYEELMRLDLRICSARCSLDKIHRLIGYIPHYSLNETLQRVIAYERTQM